MTGLERTLKTLNGEEADRVPMCPLLCNAVCRILGLRCYEFVMDSDLAGEAWLAAHKLFKFDVVVGMVDLSVEAHDFGQDTVFFDTDVVHPNEDKLVVTDWQSYGNVKPIDACVTKGPGGFSRMGENIKVLDILMNEIGKDTAITGFVFGTLGILGMMRGTEHLFSDCIKYPEEVMKAQLVIQDVQVDFIKKMAATGVHGICIDALYASGGVMSKKLWHKMEGGTARVLADTIRESDSAVMVHNCGDKVYFDAMIEAMNPQVISYACIPDDCESHAECQEKYGDKVTIMGHVEPIARILLGTEQELIDEIKLECDIHKQGGRYICAPGCEYPIKANLNRVNVMMDAVKLHGKY